MKLRIKGNSIRLRLAQNDVSRFASEGKISESVQFGHGREAFVYTLASDNEIERPAATFENGILTVFIPKKLADEWASTDEVGIEAADATPSILIEKDFACLSPREGDDESDMFPNPESSVCYNEDTVS